MLHKNRMCLNLGSKLYSYKISQFKILGDNCNSSFAETILPEYVCILTITMYSRTSMAQTALEL